MAKLGRNAPRDRETAFADNVVGKIDSAFLRDFPPRSLSALISPAGGAANRHPESCGYKGRQLYSFPNCRFNSVLARSSRPRRVFGKVLPARLM